MSVFNSYDIGGGDTIHVDTGAHLLVRDVVLSGQSILGAHEGVIITGPTDPSKVASFTRGNAGAANAVFEVNAGDFVTLAHLTLLGSPYGVWVHNASTSFTGSYLTSLGSGLDGIRVEGDAAGSAVDHLTVAGAGRNGIVVLTSVGGAQRQRGA